MRINRRQFLTAASITAAAALTSKPASGQDAKNPCICAFSKHLQFLKFPELAKIVKSIGLDGVDLTVRKGGHVAPDRLADLKPAVQAIRGEGLRIPMVTTNLNDGSDPDAEPILAAVAEQQIPYVRIGGLQYKETGNPLDQLDDFTRQLGSLARLAEKHKVTLGYHNHSGYLQFGAAIWDLDQVLQRIGSENLGSNFDPGHATAEGSFGVWQVTSRLIAPRVKMMAVKDFVWDKNKPQWVPLGKGIVQLTKVLAIMRENNFAGPISIHIEYDLASDQAMIEEFRTTAHTLRQNLQSAGYTL